MVIRRANVQSLGWVLYGPVIWVTAWKMQFKQIVYPLLCTPLLLLRVSSWWLRSLKKVHSEVILNELVSSQKNHHDDRLADLLLLFFWTSLYRFQSTAESVFKVWLGSVLAVLLRFPNFAFRHSISFFFGMLSGIFSLKNFSHAGWKSRVD